MEERLAKVELRLSRLAQAMLPIEKEVEVLKAEMKLFAKFQNRIEGQLDMIRWLVIAVPTLAAITNGVITWALTHGR